MESNIEQFRAWACDDDLVLLRQVIPLVEEGEMTWVHVAPFGQWKGHEKGPIDFTDKAFDQIIANYEAQKSDSMVGWEHDVLNPRMKGPHYAAGWIKKLEKRKDGLWALVEFIPETVKDIKAGKVRYLSPAIDFKSKDRKTNKMIGAELVNIGLTNMPFIDGLNPVMLTRFAMGDTIKETHIVEKPSQTQLELSEPAEMQDEMVDAQAAIDALAAASGLEPAAVVAGLIEKQEQVASLLQGNAEAEGSPAESEGEAEMSQKENEGTVKASVLETVKDKTIVQLSKRLEDLEKIQADKDKAAIEALVDEKIKTGYITDDMREEAIYLFTHEREHAEKIFSFQRVPIGVTQGDDPAGKQKAKALSDQEELEVDCLIAMSRGMGIKLTREKAIEQVRDGKN